MKFTPIPRCKGPLASALLCLAPFATPLGAATRRALSAADSAHAASAAVLAPWGISLAFLNQVVLIASALFTAIIVASLLIRMVITTILGRGGMGRRGVASAAMRVSLLCSHALNAAAIISGILCLAELSEAVFSTSIPDWSSYGVPLILTMGLISVTNFSILHKEEELRVQIASSEGCRRLLFERSLVGSYKATLQGRILDCNLSFCQIFGYPSRQAALASAATVGYFTSEDRDRFVRRLQTDKRVTNFEQCLRRNDGSRAWVLCCATLAAGEDGFGPIVKATMIDISEFRVELPAWARKIARALVVLRSAFHADPTVPETE